MARPLRVQYPGAFYHVTSRGNERKVIFKSKKDRERFLSYLESAHERYDAIIHSYCLMDNHYHILLETPRSNLSQILHNINGAYTSYFNVRRKRSGHLFQGRYKAILVQKDAYCQELSRYIHLNPVRAGIVGRPSQYNWSSYCYLIGLKKAPHWLCEDAVLGYFDKDKKISRCLYRDFVEKAFGKELEDPLGGVFASTFLGNDRFIKWAKEKWIGFKNVDLRSVPAMKLLMDKPSLKKIDEVVESVIGRRDRTYRKFCIYTSHQIAGYPLKKIGLHYGMRGSAISQSSRRFREVILKNSDLKKIEKEIRKRLHSVEC
ncbi:MAG: transposase [Deltaproteobacteria bacterium]|nr:transposase [Deltaproteobacteria bacterium]